MAYMFGGENVTAGRMKVFTGLSSPGTITFGMGGWTNGASAQNAVISGVSASTQGNYQFLLTLRNYTYVYLFGEKMGDVTVTGIGGIECGNVVHGINHAITYYNNFALSRTGTPVGLSFGNASTWAFLVGAKFEYMDAASRLAQFAFSFKTITQ